MTGWLKQSTSVSVVIGPVWATADGSLKADLAYNASGINCDVYKNGTKADVTLANSAGDGYFRAGSGESLYLLTLSTGHTDTLGAFTISLSATGYYMKPQHYMVVPANVWDSMFGADTLKCEVVEISGDTAAADNLESYCDGTTPIPANAIQISGDATAADNCELMFDGTGYAGGTTKLAVEVNTKTGFSLANGSIAAATFAAGAVDAAALAADAGTEIGAAVKTAVEAAGSHLALIKAKTDSLTFTVAGDVDCNVQTWKGSAAQDMTGDAYARLGAPAGASVSADIAAVKAKTDNLPADPADDSDIDTQLAAIAGYLDTEVAAILAAVDTEVAAIVAAVITNAAGADVAADIIAVKAVVDAIKAKTDLGLLNTTWTDAKAAYLDEAISAAKTLTAAYDDAKTAAQAGDEMDLIDAPNATALTAVAVAILDCLLSEGDADALNARTVRSALRALRNKSSIAAGTLTVCKENDSDAAWTAAATTDPAAEPITEIDPA